MKSAAIQKLLEQIRDELARANRLKRFELQIDQVRLSSSGGFERDRLLEFAWEPETPSERALTEAASS